MTRRIHYTKPSITSREVELATDAAATGWGPKCYDYIKKFEAGFADWLGSDYAIATSSCTGALHMGMSALGIGAGDEVVMADINWIATVAPIHHLGATPVFVDILEDSWCIDPEAAEAAITPKTKAIIATHIYGNLCDMEAFLEIGRRHNIPVIEDSAEAIGSKIGDKRAGTMGVFGSFSFHGTKTLTTGEGGMFVTSDADLYERVLTLSNHGRSRTQMKQFWPDEIGFKYKMSNIQAAIGCAQLERIDDLIDQKRAIFQGYVERLSDLPVSMNPEPAGTVNGYWMPTLVFDRDVEFSRDELLSRFKAKTIDGRVFFHPLSKLDFFESRENENPRAWVINERAVNLPTYHDMTDDDLDYVCDVVKQYAASCL